MIGTIFLICLGIYLTAAYISNKWKREATAEEEEIKKYK